MISPHNGDFIKWHAMSNWRDCLDVMQFTGLHDKNGVEIYEGDVLFENEQRYSQRKPRRHSVVVWKDAGWCREAFNGQLKVHPPINVREMQVIGNIYQNPELLAEGEPK